MKYDDFPKMIKLGYTGYKKDCTCKYNRLFDFSLIEKEVPFEVLEIIKQNAVKTSICCQDTYADCFSNDGNKYYVDIQYKTSSIYKNDNRIYTLFTAIGALISVYEPNMYGIISGNAFPIKHKVLGKWSTGLISDINDVYIN